MSRTQQYQWKNYLQTQSNYNKKTTELKNFSKLHITHLELKEVKTPWKKNSFISSCSLFTRGRSRYCLLLSLFRSNSQKRTPTLEVYTIHVDKKESVSVWKGDFTDFKRTGDQNNILSLLSHLCNFVEVYLFVWTKDINLHQLLIWNRKSLLLVVVREGKGG